MPKPPKFDYQKAAKAKLAKEGDKVDNFNKKTPRERKQKAVITGFLTKAR